MSAERPLDVLARLYGIAPSYADIWGGHHPASDDTVRALLRAMGVATHDDAAIAAAIREREERPWRRRLPPVVVIRADRDQTIPVVVPAERAGDTLSWTVEPEDGEPWSGTMPVADLATLATTVHDGVELSRRALALPDLPPPGYHHLVIELAGERSTTGLVVAPERCYAPAALADDGRVWGPALQLYAVHSRRSWGIGDFSDLATLVERSADAGADVVGLNPVHALFPRNPESASPYGPSSRLYLNVLYIDVEAVPELAECAEAQAQLRGAGLQHRLRTLRASKQVDYSEVAALKLEVLETLYREFRRSHLDADSERGRAYRAFAAERGETLRRFALFEALDEHFRGIDAATWGWPVWPEAYRDPAAPAVAEFASSAHERVDFHCWLQWLADGQLGQAARLAYERRLGVGLYLDLAVSVDRAGAEAWSWQSAYAVGATIGAPPDDFNVHGQNWGLPPLSPDALTESGYAPFIETLRANMRHAGAMRIDHVMGLMRLFWIPDGESGAAGAYVSYPFDDLLGILALESQRNRCLVVGEDLGTVPDEVRVALAPLGVLSYRLLYFEKSNGGEFRPPADYPQQALVAVTTHDLATLAGFWSGADIEERTALGLHASDAAREAQVLARGDDRVRLLFALEREGLLPDDVRADPASAPDMTPALARAIHRYLARSPAALLMVQLEDIIGETMQVNLPGTTDERPNWRLRLPPGLEDITADERFRLFAAALSTERPPARAAAAAQPAEAAIPRATYRLQLNAAFGFAEAAAIVPYLAHLGVSHVYCSPYLKARSGSHHGYDIVDHSALNPELGSDADFAAFTAALDAHGLQQILDIVPNHMGVGGSDNAWWLDVLENGPASAYAGYFDIDWNVAEPSLNGKVLVPMLGRHYGEALEAGELKMVLDTATGCLAVWYYEHCFPLDPGTYHLVLGQNLDRLEERLTAHDPRLAEFTTLLTALRNLPPRDAHHPRGIEERRHNKEVHKSHLAHLYTSWPEIRAFIDENIVLINGTAGVPESFDLLDEILTAQAYRLAHFRVAGDEINYRRFFDINDLAGVAVENPEVFALTHRLVMDLVGRGQVTGLRVDHPDGLYAPAEYYRRLQTAAAAALRGDPNPLEGLSEKPEPAADALPLYVVVEKILATHERLPDDWPVHGTTGYEFLNLLTGVLVDSAGEDGIERAYREFTGMTLALPDIVYEQKKRIMRVSMSSELNVLAAQLTRVARADRRTRDFTRTALRDALTETVACFPVYRTYVSPDGTGDLDRRHVDWAVARARRMSVGPDASVFDFVRRMVLLEDLAAAPPRRARAMTEFALRFQQYTGPVMAKALEDTSFYIYNRLVSLNEVGGDPERFGVSVAAFHHANQARYREWPHAMLASMTHDTKRSADVRARIDVLSEIPGEWAAQLARMVDVNAARRRLVGDVEVPDRNEEYLIYQTLLGAWPTVLPEGAALAAFRVRIDAYLVKALREAKVHTNWLNPDTTYEQAVLHFVAGLFAQPELNGFLAGFRPFAARVARAGYAKSLVTVGLKLTCPGVPDIYQGDELLDLSLVDPDNRRPVDFDARARILDEIDALLARPTDERQAELRALAADDPEGRIKLALVRALLTVRREHEAWLRDGDYVPLALEGPNAERALAFARSGEGGALIVVASRLHAAGGPWDGEAAGDDWAGTRVLLEASGSGPLPGVAGGRLEDVVSGAIHVAGASGIKLSELLSVLPLAVLRTVPPAA